MTRLLGAGMVASAVLGWTQAPAKVAVAHRGASAHAPEHTLAAYRLAMDQGADYVEQDLGLTKDGVLVCLHDVGLERTTNVEELFPDRFTEIVRDGKTIRQWRVDDFTLSEIKRLDAGSWFGAKFAGERVPTWHEAVDLVRGRAGLYPELKSPEVYRDRGVRMEPLVVESLRRNGLDGGGAGKAPVILQSFDEETLRVLARELPRVPRVFLMEPAAGRRWLTADALREAAAFVTGIGPTKLLLDGRPEIVQWAHAAGLTVTPYTFRSSSTGRFKSVADEMRYYLYDLGVDAVFTDNPDQFPRTR